jgi:cytochrome c oxidase subunit 2
VGNSDGTFIGQTSDPNSVNMDQFHLFPPQASTSAHEVDVLYFTLILISLFFIAVVFLPILYFCIKYRRGSPADRSNPLNGSNMIEVGWTSLPA